MEHGALVTVIVPIYNVEPYLEQCVDSIRRQTMGELEIILIDDGSPDGCPQMCDRFAGEDERIRVFHQENAGVSAARNRGIDAASADWLMFVDSDDWLEPDAVKLLYEKAVDSGCDVICATYYENAPGKQEIFKLNPKEEGIRQIGRDSKYILDRILRSVNGAVNLRGPCMKLFRKSRVVDGRCRFPSGIRYGEDRIFNLQVLLNTRQIYVLNVPIYHYRKRRGSATGTVYESGLGTFHPYADETRRILESRRLLETYRAYYYYVLIAEVIRIAKLMSAEAKSWKDLRKPVLFLRQAVTWQECADALCTPETFGMMRSRRRFMCRLLRLRMYRTFAAVSFLNHLLSAE